MTNVGGGSIASTRFSGRIVVTAVLAATALAALPAAAQALEQKLIASDGAAHDNFGLAVAIDGDTAVVGTPGEDASTGALYVFARSGDSWSQTAKLVASGGATGDNLGDAVAIDGETIVAGAPLDDLGASVDQGSVYTFDRSCAASSCTETAQLLASDGDAGDNFGDAVAIDGDTVVASAWARDMQRGALYTFARTCAASPCEEVAMLVAADAAPGDTLGDSVAIDGETIVAGATYVDFPATPNQGAAYSFARTCATSPCTATAKFVASDGGDLDRFGSSVAIRGETIVVGAPTDDVGANQDQGSAYTFDRGCSASPCNETAKLLASDGTTNDVLGVSVAIDGETIVAGAPFEDVGTIIEEGAAYTFARAGAAARTETAMLVASDGAGGDFFGSSVAIDGETIVAGTPLDDIGVANFDQGSISVFYPATPAAPLPPIPQPPYEETVGCPPGTSASVTCSRDGQGRLHLQGTDLPEVFVGTNMGDVMAGEGGKDEMTGSAGDDRLVGDAGRDSFSAGGGNDRVDSSGQTAESVRCGGGRRDRVSGARGDDVSRNCEIVRRR